MSTLDDYRILPAVALRGLVVFPGMSLNFDVGREKSIDAVKAAYHDDGIIFLVAQKDLRDDDPDESRLFKMGTAAKITHIARLPGSDALRISVEGLYRASLLEIVQDKPYLIADVRIRKSTSVRNIDTDYVTALIRQTKDYFEDYAQIAPHVSKETVLEVIENDDPAKLSDYIAGNILLEYKKRQQILNELNTPKRLEAVCRILADEGYLLQIENEINDKVQESIDRNQKEYYLQEQLKAISEELGGGTSEVEECEELKQKICALKLDPKSEEKLLKECSRLRKMSPTSPEAAVGRAYLETCLELPWHTYTKDSLNIKNARRSLDKDHYGLKKVKERITEALAVRQLTDGNYGQILCLVGPPGVGKTSVAKSIANAMGRNFARISLGGVKDEAEIRGHRKTYIGSMPGRIISAVKSAGSHNPVILLDEVDKLGNDYKGDPSSALLEVLDREQNNSFTDHYLDIPFDLSPVMFITTANDASSIPAPLLDRMEIIELPSYTHEEKFNIARKHLIPKQIKLHGLTPENFKISSGALHELISGYTREAGVRLLEQNVASLCRKAAAEIVADSNLKFDIKPDQLESLLGPQKYTETDLPHTPLVGVVNGLAWTSVGGELLQAECVIMDGTGKLELTGSLGDVMKESAQAAVSYLRSKADVYRLSPTFYKDKDIHIHFPEGAVPKDGPSAGVTIATVLLSALTSSPVNQKLAMTGEISLTGRVLPIGGLREKTMAAYRNGIKTVLIPKKNLPDLVNLDQKVLDALDIIPVSCLDDVFAEALIKKQPDRRQRLTVPAGAVISGSESVSCLTD